MKNIFLLFILLPLYALNISAKNSKLKNQLIELNQNWEHFNLVALDNDYNYTNEVDLIKLHLSLVEDELRRNTPSNLSAIQKQNRITCLDILNKYWNNGVFPKNTFHSARTPYFIDIYGTYCAVGYLIKETGFDDIAQKIHKENNYGYIKDLKKEYEEIDTWANLFGFTTDELAWIQPSYGNPWSYPYYCVSNVPTTQVQIINEKCDTNQASLGSVILPSICPSTLLPVSYAALVSYFPLTPTQVNCGGLTAGCYKFYLFDTTNNMDSIIACVQLDSSIFATSTVTNSSCNNNCNGIINVSPVLNGLPPFTYTISGASFVTQSSNIFSSLCGGTYSLKVKNQLGCYYDTTFIISSPTSIVSMLSSNSDNGTGNGTAKCIPSGGTPPYTFIWSNSSTSDSIANLSSGMYYVTITDANLCQMYDSVFVPLVFPAGIENSPSFNFAVYPNPSHGAFSVQFDHIVQAATLEIVNLLGEKIYEQKISTQQKETIQFDAPIGMYILKIKIAGRDYTQKITKF